MSGRVTIYLTYTSDFACEIVDYERLNEQLQAVGVATGAAEIHGMFCGLICGGCGETDDLRLGTVLDGLDPRDPLVQECEQGLREAASETCGAIHGPELAFTPLFPDDERPLEERTQALQSWCQGFLYGIGLTGTRHADLSAEANEALRDLADIARIEVELGEDAEADEEAYMELQEFIRVAALLIHGERLRYGGEP